jgi:hypothetical protein
LVGGGGGRGWVRVFPLTSNLPPPKERLGRPPSPPPAVAAARPMVSDGERGEAGKKIKGKGKRKRAEEREREREGGREREGDRERDRETVCQLSFGLKSCKNNPGNSRKAGRRGGQSITQSTGWLVGNPREEGRTPPSFSLKVDEERRGSIRVGGFFFFQSKQASEEAGRQAGRQAGGCEASRLSYKPA